ncbi:hypothetical protein J437_LFUL006219 [Ladona fulva]|uniref:Uncharacterized protein n=1 Tax=Ladona fulva TaxID=123851 RepID=A0A8K0K5V0_LADFU|nr:hypothetical protein J437_LFUL006219 [Ladona fulva]
MSLLSDQFKITSKKKAALLEVCLFVVTAYVKPWLQCILASMKVYEKIDKSIAKAALQEINQHLLYMSDEFSVLSLFDDDMDQETKVKMVENLSKEILSTHGKRYIPSKEELCGPLYDHCFLTDFHFFISKKNIYDFSQKQSPFDRLKIDDSFIH